MKINVRFIVLNDKNCIFAKQKINNMKQLQEGDLIFKSYLNFTSNIGKIERVTDKFAYVGAYKFKRDYYKYLTVWGEKGYLGLYFVPNDEEVNEYIKSNVRRKVICFNYNKLNDNTIKKIYDIIKDC